jgi:tetrahydromethanopterin S-methyltransferase subunit B
MIPITKATKENAKNSHTALENSLDQATSKIETMEAIAIHMKRETDAQALLDRFKEQIKELEQWQTDALENSVDTTYGSLKSGVTP